MKKVYLYNGQLMQEADVIDAAKQSNLDLNSYIQKAGIKSVDDSYSLGGKNYSASDILDAANQSKLGFDDYIQKAGFQKKSQDGNGLEVSANGNLQPSGQSDSEVPFSSGGVDVKAEADKYKSEHPNDEYNSYNPIDLAKESDAKSKETISANDPLSVNGSGSIETENPASVAASKKIDANLTERGYDPKQLKSLFSDFPDDYYNVLGINKDQMAQEIKNNPAHAQQVISSAKWQIPLQQEAIRQGADVGAIQNMRDAFASKETDFATKRKLAPQLLQTIRQFAPDNATMQKWQSNFANDAAQAYGDVKDNDPTLAKDQALYPDLNPNQVRALDYLKDVAPDQAQSYAAALVDPKKLKNNYDAQVGQEEKLKRLDEIGIGLQTNSLQQKLSDNPDDEESKTQYNNLVNQRNDLLIKYPKAGVNDAELFAQELLGQKHTGLNWMALESGKSTGNAVKGIWDLVSEPFRSDENSKTHQLSTLGDLKDDESETNLTQENLTNQTFKPTVSKGLQVFIDDLKNNKDFSDSEKRRQLTEMLMKHPDMWQRTPIEGGKSNLGLTSLAYGTGQLAANLAPYVLAETATGGGASAGIARKFTSSFASALGTGFHEAYQDAINSGEADPYTTALRRTAINSAAMAGSQTPEAIRDMLAGTKSAAGDIVGKMTDDEILGALRKEPKTMASFRDAIGSVKNTGKNIIESSLGGVKAAGKILPFTTAGQVANDAFDDNVKSPQDYLKQAAIEGLKFGILGGIGGTLGKIGKEPNDLSKAALYTAGSQPEAFLEALKQKEDNGSISPKDAEQVKENIEKAKEVFKKVPFVDSHGKALSEKDRRDLLFLKMQENDLEDHISSDLPESLVNTMQKRLSDTQDKIDTLYKGTLIDEPSKPEVAPEQPFTAKGADAKAKDLLAKLQSTNAPSNEVSEPDQNEPLIQAYRDKTGVTKEAVSDEDLLKNISEQAQNIGGGKLHETGTPEDAYNSTVNQAGKELTDAAIKEYPKEKLISSPNTTDNEKASKTEKVESNTTGVESKNAPVDSEDDGNATGIRHESLRKIADKLGLKQPERGNFLTPEEQTQRGRLLLKGGADPEKIASDFKEDGKVNADIISVSRAHLENLVKSAQKAFDTFGKNSKEFRDAQTQVQKWQDEVAKPMGTSSGGAFSALQGENDLDTGSFIATKIALEDRTGKPITLIQEKKITDLTKTVKDLTSKNKELEKKLQAELDKHAGDEKSAENIKTKAKRIANNIRKGKLSRPDVFSAATPASLVWDSALEVSAKTVEGLGTIAQAIADGVAHIKESDWYKGLGKDKQTEVEKSFTDFMNDKGKTDDIATRFVDKKDSKFEPQDSKDIWEYAKKNYIDQDYSYGDMLRGVSRDLGLTAHQVREALSQPKSVRVITDEMYRMQQKRIDAINAAKQYVKNSNQSKLVKFAKALPNAFFRLKVFGHGTVGAITHAGMNIFNPTKWKHYFPFFLKQFKFAFGSTAEYAKAMEDLKNDPDFTFWKRAGLAVDPSEVYDDYQALKPLFGRLSVAGDRGFNALKVYRLDLAKSLYNNLSQSEKADDNTQKEIAQLVNHSTGTTNVKVPSVANTLFFAPKLEISRWQSLITDPAKAIGTFVNWNKATESEKASAKIVAKNAGEKMATYMAMLAANQGLLSLVGSKQSINFTDPTKSDWLKFKAGDKTIDVSGGTLSTMRFIGALVNEARIAYTGDKQDFKTLHGDKPQDKDYKTVMQQVRYKMSPFASTITDLITGTDAMGKPLPFSNVKPKKGEEGYSVGSYIGEQLSPIPISEGIKATVESMKEKGMTDAQISDLFQGLEQFVIAGATGAKVADDKSDDGIAGEGGGASGKFPKQPKQPTQPKQPGQ